MTPDERSEMITALHKAQGDLHALFEKCRVGGAFVVGSRVATALDAVNDALDEFKPDIAVQYPHVMR